MTVRCLRNVVVCILGLQLCACANSNFSISEWFNSNAEDDSSDKLVSQPMPPKQTDVPDPGAIFRQELKQELAKKKRNKNRQNPQEVTQYRTPSTLYSPKFSHKSLSDYAEQLTMKLMSDGRTLPMDSLIAVTTFVNFDQSLKNSSVLGNQLSELMIAELQTFGVDVADFKTMDQISVNSTGDFIFSRNAQQLSASMTMNYVMSGTLIRNEKGVRVNARIVDVQSKLVVSAASLFIPEFVVKALQPSIIVVSTN